MSIQLYRKLIKYLPDELSNLITEYADDSVKIPKNLFGIYHSELAEYDGNMIDFYIRIIKEPFESQVEIIDFFANREGEMDWSHLFLFLLRSKQKICCDYILEKYPHKINVDALYNHDRNFNNDDDLIDEYFE